MVPSSAAMSADTADWSEHAEPPILRVEDRGSLFLKLVDEPGTRPNPVESSSTHCSPRCGLAGRDHRSPGFTGEGNARVTSACALNRRGFPGPLRCVHSGSELRPLFVAVDREDEGIEAGQPE